MRLARAVPVPAREWVRAHVPHSVWSLVRDTAAGRTPAQRAARDARRSATLALGTRGAAAGTRDGWVAVEAGSRTYVARRVTSFRAGRVLDDALDLVADALEAAGVGYFVLDAEPGVPRVVVVREGERAAAVGALADAARGDVVHVGRPDGGSVGAVRVLRGPRSVPARARVLRLFRVLAGPEGGFLGGPELGCDVEFWREVPADRPAEHRGDPVPPGTLVAPRPNRWAEVLPRSAQELTTRTVGGTQRPVLAAQRHPHVTSVRFPVDVVYTWVDGSDPAWLERKAATLAEYGAGAAELSALATNASRFVSRDELRYSLRSLDMYADWVRHVHLVTDDQVPPWLDLDNPRLTVVSHRELFAGHGRLPTFNSHAIETRLHHVEGLSEQFLYLNDDVFFGRPVRPSQFFLANGLSTFHPSAAKVDLGPADPADTPLMSAGKRNRELLEEAFGVSVTDRFWHVPHALRRSTLLDLEERFADDVERTASTPFRSPRDVSVAASLGHWYGWLTGRAVPGDLRYFYADIAQDDTPARLAGLLDRRDHDVFCLNDHDSSAMDPAAQARVVGDFLEAYFPVPSSFER